ncbi:hypothetical protein [Methanosarcina barkeri]|uniref:von Willebrand factor domain-containing protein n=1 Tax=Methanosarcina barkeri CM1 TaxID=796385 RepID=A0A0G3CG89_METBA|nr:hypothetical protein [Methanosarcina barkeri]AKJ38943.1 von Willebrand factor domain-containing protein [Methanosarcina barkeri CM1]
MNISLEHPEMLLLIIPVTIAGFYLLRKTKTKIVEWRMLVAFLLVLALAAPFTTVTQTVNEDNPSLVLVQDKTSSMGLFSNETGDDLYKALAADTSTTLVQLTGDKTNLGDAVTQYSGTGNQIVLITDGNNNSGKSLVDALGFAKETNTPVYLVEPELKTNDLSVEILGDKDAIVDNQKNYSIVVRQASNQSVSYSYEAYVDGELSQSGDVTQNSTQYSITPNLRHTFSTLGAHNISVKITPSGEDLNSINNKFYKSVYVIPKPKLTLVTSEPNSPLAQILNKLYNTSAFTTYPGASVLNSSKALILDNQFINNLSETQVKEISKYVNNGGGLVVVGGTKSYEKPASASYRNSSIEKLLPVISRPSETTGKNYIILILDLSGSTFQGGPQKVVVDGVASYPLYPILIDSAKNILKSDALEGSEVGFVIIGEHNGNVSSGLHSLNSASIDSFESELSSLVPTNKLANTNLSQGILDAKNIFEKETPPDSSKYIMIISDGVEAQDPTKTGKYYSTEMMELARRVHEEDNVGFIYIDINSTNPRKVSAENLKNFMNKVDGQYIGNITSVSGAKKLGNLESEASNETENTPLPDHFNLRSYSRDNFITKGVNFTTIYITGYNDVTPKSGAERLVTTDTGKPVLTTWRFGLGRVAAFTTDNGQGDGSRWATNVYNRSNAKLISSMINWAIANPKAEEGAVVDSPDTWLGTSSNLTLTMYDEGIPQLKLDGNALDLALTGRNTYETTVNPDSIGIHDISGYPLAVNYPLEYRDVGLNEDIEPLVLATGGEIYNEKEARALLLKDARQNSVKQSDEQVSLKVYVLLAALVLYLGEILARRIREMRKLKNAQVET